MKIVGLITEYNPFHNGHLHHIQAAKQKTGADGIVVLMSGNFVQRGEPAFLSKQQRASFALEAGADLVLELPVYFSTGSAEYFAQGSISIFDSLSSIDFICFGTEAHTLEVFQSILPTLIEEPETFRLHLAQSLKSGLSFPKSRAAALAALFPQLSPETLSSPNNILALEYLKALSVQGSEILPLSIPRVGAGYHSTSIQQTFPSATAVRDTLLDAFDSGTSFPFEVLKFGLPDFVLSLLKKEFAVSYPLLAEDFSSLLFYKLLQETPEGLCQYLDVHPEMANRIYKNLSSFTTMGAFAQTIKTKEITLSRIQRGLLHILLGIKTKHLDSIKNQAPYVRVLGFSKKKSADSLLCCKKQQNPPHPANGRPKQLRRNRTVIIGCGFLRQQPISLHCKPKIFLPLSKRRRGFSLSF